MSSPLDIEMRGHTGALAYDFGTDYTRVFGQAPSASAQEWNGPRSFDSASSSPSSMRVQKGTSWSSGGDASWRPHANLYVKNISERIDEMTLRTMFEACGEVVSCCVIRDVATNRSRGFGFVKFASTSRAEDAIERFNGRECAGKILEVKFANTDGESDKGDSHGTAPPSDNVYVKGLPPTWTQDNLKKYFSKFGHIVECRLLHANKSTSSGALIRFLRESEATAAVKATNGNVIAPGGPPLVVRYADAQGKNTKRGGQSPPNGRIDDSAHDGTALSAMLSESFKRVSSNNGLSELMLGLPGSEEDAAAIAALGTSPTFTELEGAIMCVSNLPPLADELFLYKSFAPFGAIVSTQIIHNVMTGVSTAVISFRKFSDAMNARHVLQIGGSTLSMTVQRQRL